MIRIKLVVARLTEDLPYMPVKNSDGKYLYMDNLGNYYWGTLNGAAEVATLVALVKDHREVSSEENFAAPNELRLVGSKTEKLERGEHDV